MEISLMGVLDILSDVKGKVLDSVHFDMLESAYQLQEENILQLKSNNEALKENNGLLKEKVTDLQSQLKNLSAEIEPLRELKLKEDLSNDELSANAKTIIELFIETDSTSLDENFMIQKLPFGKIEFSAAMRELEAFDIAEWGSASFDGGLSYHLTDAGSEFVADYKLKNLP